tara:strand:+ start:1060 stop:1197 length:138 start_codon:yes stop_codon:yes gene_type:complete
MSKRPMNEQEDEPFPKRSRLEGWNDEVPDDGNSGFFSSGDEGMSS